MKPYLPAALLLAALPCCAADTTTAAGAINKFGLELHQRLAKGDTNLCLSPYSIQSALAMTYTGADGATREEMAKVLHFPKDDAALQGSFSALSKAFAELTAKTTTAAQNAKKWGGPSEPVTLNVANRLFGQKGYAFRDPFLSFLKDGWGAPLELMNFHESEKARQHINGWVEDQTHKRIRELLPPRTIDNDTRLVLVNAFYLKAPWGDEFSASLTKPRPFHINGGAPKDVATMRKKQYFGYAKRDGYSAVSLPYAGNDLHFLVIVPDDPKGLAAIEKSLTAETLAECARLPGKEVLLDLPKFKIEPPSIDLGEELIALGMKSAFDRPEGSANFDRMAPRKPNDYLFISKVIHKTFLALDEKGTEAAAATAVVMPRAAAAPAEPPKPIEVKVDRPFLFAIQHGPSGACLFLGRVTNPS